MPEANRLGAIIVVFNQEAGLLKDCLTAISRSTRRPDEVILVVNDGRRDLSTTLIGLDLKVRVLANSRNVGFAAGVNQGVQAASSEFIVLINDDAVLAPDCLTNLIDVLQSGTEVGIVSPVIYFKSPPGEIWFAGGKINAWLGLCQERRQVLTSDFRSEWVSGCVMMFRRELWKRLGGFDESYFLYFEDADFCLRARRRGYTVLTTPRALAWHGRADLKGQSDDFRLRYVYASKFRFLTKNFSPLTAFVSILFQLVPVSLYDLVIFRQGPKIKIEEWVKFVRRQLVKTK